MAYNADPGQDKQMISGLPILLSLLSLNVPNHQEGQQTLSGHERIVFAISFSPDGTKLISAGYDNTLRLWDLATKQDKTIKLASSSSAAAYSPSGQWFASAGDRRNVVQLWAASGEKAAELIGDPSKDYGIRCLVFSPNSSQLAVGHQGGLLRIWDVASKKIIAELQKINASGDIRQLSFAPSGKQLLSCSEDLIAVWELANFKPVLKFNKSRDWKAACFVNDQRFVTGDSQGNFQFWDTNGTEVQKTLVQRSGIECLVVTPDGHYVLTPDENHNIALYDAVTGKLAKRLLNSAAGKIAVLAVSSDSSKVSFAYQSGYGYDIYMLPMKAAVSGK